jgi:DnaJ domain
MLPAIVVPESTGSGLGESSSDVQLIFVSDASAEAERLHRALGARGYAVVDVPLSLLVSRVGAQPPSLIVCDVDADGALETIHRLRDVPGAASIDVVFLGDAGRTLDSMRDAVFHESSAVFVRPVDAYAVVRKIEALIGPPSGPVASLRPSYRSPLLSEHPSSRPPSARADVPKSDRPSAHPPPSVPPPSSELTPNNSYPSLVTYEPVAASEPPGVPAWSLAPDMPSSPAPSEPSAPSLPAPVPLALGGAEGKRPFSQHIPQSEMSEELERLLARAEQRIHQAPASSNPPASRMPPDAEVDAVLPADVLAALDEPLDQEDDEEEEDDSVSGHGTRTGLHATGSGMEPVTSPEAGAERAGGTGLVGPPAATTGAGTTAIGGSLFPRSGDAVPDSVRPATDAGAGAGVSEPPVTPPAIRQRPSGAPEPEQVPFTSSDVSSAGTQHGLPPSSQSMPGVAVQATTRPPLHARAGAPPTARAPTEPPRGATEPHTPSEPPDREPHPTTPPQGSDELPRPSGLEIPTALAPGDAFTALARAVQSRYTGALALEDASGIRRIVMRDGDLVTAASGVEGESLVAFLTQRGVLDADVANKLGRKIAQFGRHAGAALIAHGHLQQDELWPVLRAHAEWIVGRTITMERGAVSLEKQIPGRLQAEPAVFGGATGAEVLVEIVRRTVSPNTALKALGGPRGRLAEGAAASLLSECALTDAETALVARATDSMVGELLESAGPDFAPVLYALAELGVLKVEKPEARDSVPSAPPRDDLDDAAVRARIAARIALVENGDYFALLGVSRKATGYDIRRAYLELRRQFEPSYALSAATADLRDQVDTIVEVLDEAYEILHDQRRRERYRRALEAAPG